jgi:transcriptional regulator with XRE-family HTH domain
MMDGRGRDEATALALGKNLVKARRHAGFSQETLATRCLLHRTEIGNIENGRRIPRVDTMIRIAGALEVKADVLLAGIEWLPPPPTPPPVGFVFQFPG